MRAAWQVDLNATLNTNYWAAVGLHPGPDVREGITAFIEKRPARFNQRYCARNVRGRGPPTLFNAAQRLDPA